MYEHLMAPYRVSSLRQTETRITSKLHICSGDARADEAAVQRIVRP